MGRVVGSKQRAAQRVRMLGAVHEPGPENVGRGATGSARKQVRQSGARESSLVRLAGCAGDGSLGFGGLAVGGNVLLEDIGTGCLLAVFFEQTTAFAIAFHEPSCQALLSCWFPVWSGDVEV